MEDNLGWITTLDKIHLRMEDDIEWKMTLDVIFREPVNLCSYPTSDSAIESEDLKKEK